MVIAARNESKVIGQLIDSIQKQTYPSELVTIFVVADNCTDNTAQIAREKGAVVYERFDKEHATKGYALQFLFRQIARDYDGGTDFFEAYFVFDADNILKADYIERMNDAFDSGQKIVASYRNSKNIETNWISAMYSIHFLRACRTYHRGRSVLGTSTTIQGTGYMFDSDLIKNGWNYVSLTEDRAFAADAAACGYYVSYQHDAEFYDEQPTSIKIVLRQRIRWAKGHLQAFTDTGGKLIVNTFKKASFSCYDMFSRLIPTSIIKFFWGIVAMCFTITQQAITHTFSMDIFYNFFLGVLIANAVDWVGTMPAAIYVLFMERKRVKKLPLYKKAFYVFMFPFFGLIELPVKLYALFTNVKWKPIPHTNTLGAEEIQSQIKK